jgi:hypothetical protein
MLICFFSYFLFGLLKLLLLLHFSTLLSYSFTYSDVIILISYSDLFICIYLFTDSYIIILICSFIFTFFPSLHNRLYYISLAYQSLILLVLSLPSVYEPWNIYASLTVLNTCFVIIVTLFVECGTGDPTQSIASAQ